MAKNIDVRSNDRVISLTPVGDAKDVTGLIDRRLFKGQNKLHAVMDETGLWNLHFDSGIMPEELKQRFTSFLKALDAVEKYYKKRNVAVKEVID